MHSKSPTPEKGSVKFLTITELQEGQRIDNFLLKHAKGLPRSHVYQIVRKGEVRVNKKRIKPDYRLKVGDIIRIPPLRLGVPSEAKIPSQSLQQLLAHNILFEDKGLLVINKPAGIAVHGGSGVSIGIIEALRSIRQKEPFLELVHRLDRETSGCLVLAKKPSTLKELHELLRNGQVEKRYTTLVQGHWPNYLREIDEPLKKSQLQSGERMVSVHNTGKPSLTKFQVIQRFAMATLMEAKPQTGRTHQIRVHATHAGHPIIGDEKYGDKDTNRQFRTLGCKRLFLHASSISFILPSSGQAYTILAPLDDELKRFLENLSKFESLNPS